MFDFAKVVSAARSATSKFVELSVRGLGDEDSDQSAEAADQVAFLSPLGLLVMPAVQRSLRALVARVGGPVEAVALALWDKAIAHDPAPSNGETRLFSAQWPKVCVRLLDGLIEIRVGTTTGTVKLAPDGTGYADKNVARVDDDVACGTVTALGVAPGSPIQFVFTPQSGAALPASPTLTIVGKITSGSPRVKA